MTAPDPDELPFHYESRGRTLFNLALFAIGLALLALAYMTQAMMIVYVPLAAFALGVGYLIVVDPRAGIHIDSQAVTIWHGSKRERISISDIERVHMEHWSDNVDITVFRRDGGSVAVPSRCHPDIRVLKYALRRAGIALTHG